MVFLAVAWFGLQCVILVFPGHAHLLLNIFGLVISLLKKVDFTINDAKTNSNSTICRKGYVFDVDMKLNSKQIKVHVD